MDSALKIFSIDAMILVQGDGKLSGEHLAGWKNHYTKIAVIHPDAAAAEEGARNLDGVIDFEITAEESPGKKKEQPGEVLKKVIEKLRVPPKKAALVSEDPGYISGARRMGLTLVIGIREQTPGKRKLYDKGAHLVLERLEDISVYRGGDTGCSFTQNLPNVFADLNKFETPFSGRKPVFFLDYDGTLTPIVRDPSSASLPEHTRVLLKGLSRRYTVAVVSGRDMDDIKQFIGLDQLIYAGSHGFRISGPEGLYMEHEKARTLLSGLDRFEQHLRNTVEKEIDGVEVERKYFAIAVHYRNAPPKTLNRIREEADHLIAGNSNFKKKAGERRSLRSNHPWNGTRGKPLNGS